MAIKINGKDLAKRIINGKEVQKVMLNGSQIRPTEVPPTPSDDYLCFTANESNCTIELTYTGSYAGRVELETSYDKTNWSDYSRVDPTITLANIWDKVYWRNKSTTQVSLSSEYSTYRFIVPRLCSLSWDITYLLCKTWTTVVGDYDFAELFENQEWIVTTPRLPATTLGIMCYYGMFSGCLNLETLPELPATTLTDYCYEHMFDGNPKIKLSTTQTWEYQTPYRIPTTWTWTTWTWSLDEMFGYTWGTFTGTPNINQTYYTSNTIIS